MFIYREHRITVQITGTPIYGVQSGEHRYEHRTEVFMKGEHRFSVYGVYRFFYCDELELSALWKVGLRIGEEPTQLKMCILHATLIKKKSSFCLTFFQIRQVEFQSPL